MLVSSCECSFAHISSIAELVKDISNGASKRRLFPLLHPPQQLPVPLQQRLQLCWEQQPEVPGGHHVLQCRQVDIEEDLQIVDVPLLRVDELTDHHLSAVWGGRECVCVWRVCGRCAEDVC